MFIGSYELQSWLSTSTPGLILHGVTTRIIKGDGLSVDPDIVFGLESDTMIATIGIWFGLQEAELHAVSTAANTPLVLDRLFRP